MRTIAKSALALFVAGQLVACQPAVDVDTALENAEVAVQAGEVEEAQVLLKQAISDHPNNADARRQYGFLLLELGSYENAAKELGKAKEFGDDSAETQLALLRSELKSGNFKAVRKYRGSGDSFSNAQLAELQVYKGLAALQAGEKSEAQEYLRQANDAAVDSQYGLLSRAYIASTEEEWESAIATLEEVIRNYPGFAEAYVLLGQLYGQQQYFDKAVEVYEAYAELKPRSEHAKLYLANSLVQNHEFAKAEPILKSLSQLYPDHPFINQLRATVAFTTKDYEAAKRFSDKAMQMNLRSDVTLAINGISAYYLEAYEQAYRSLMAVAPRLNSDHPARKVLMLTQLQLGYEEDLAAQLDSSAFSGSDVGLLSQSGLALAKKGDTEGARKALNLVENFGDLSAEEKVQTGLLKLQLNEKAGIDDLISALEENPDLLSAQRALIDTYVEEGNNQALLTLAQELLNSKKNDLLAYNLLARGYLGLQQTEKAEEALNKALEINENNAFSIMYFAREEANKENYQAAAEKLKPLLDARPDHIPALQAYFTYLNKAGQREKAVAELKEAAEKATSSSDIKLMYAQVLFQDGKYKQVQDMLDRMEDSKPQPNIYWVLGVDSSIKAGDMAEAHAYLDKWTKVMPKNEAAYLTKAAYYARQGNVAAALNTTRAGVKALPASTALALLNVQFLIQNNKHNLADSLLSEMSKSPSTKVAIEGLKGQIDVHRRDVTDNDVQALVAFYNQHPSQFSVNGVVAAFNQLKDKAGLTNFLQNAVEARPEDTYIRKLYAETLFASDPAQAISLYETVIEQNPEDLVSINNLAWLYADAQQFDKASATIQKGLQLSSEIPFLLDTAGEIEKAQENYVQAKEFFKKAYSLAYSPNIAMNYAEVLIATGEKSKASDILADIEQSLSPTLAARKQKLEEQLN